ncbi:MAG: phosphomethylpyrimidine synthase ThiC, partial [Selenomonadales bacterium]|nr:phosphomethylpyrimidine synthase ThiC [Selenomonadales bacterium]
MATQMSMARQGKITEAMAIVAKQEGLSEEVIRQRVAEGTVSICANINHTALIPRGVGKGLSTKTNANIGTSSAYPDIEPELDKLQAAIDAGADSVMDLSTGNNIDATRKAIIEKSSIIVGTVPIYQATVDAIKTRGAVVDMTADDMLHVIEQHAKDGADFMTL